MRRRSDVVATARATSDASVRWSADRVIFLSFWFVLCALVFFPVYTKATLGSTWSEAGRM